MGHGEASSSEGVSNGHRKFKEFSLLQDLGIVCDQLFRFGQFANSVFCSDFPGRGAADKDAIFGVANDVATSGVEFWVVKEPSQQNMGIE